MTRVQKQHEQPGSSLHYGGHGGPGLLATRHNQPCQIYSQLDLSLRRRTCSPFDVKVDDLVAMQISDSPGDIQQNVFPSAHSVRGSACHGGDDNDTEAIPLKMSCRTRVSAANDMHVRIASIICRHHQC